MPAKKSHSFRSRMRNVLQLPSVLSSETVVSNSKTLLRWGNDDNKGIVSSGWSLTRGAHICFKDEVATKDKVQLIIEPSNPGSSLAISFLMSGAFQPNVSSNAASKVEAHGYFFEKNHVTGNGYASVK
jgi:hypothetical protein